MVVVTKVFLLEQEDEFVDLNISHTAANGKIPAQNLQPIAIDEMGCVYEAPFVFDMFDVTAVSLSPSTGYTTLYLGGDVFDVKLSIDEAIQLFKDSREEG